MAPPLSIPVINDLAIGAVNTNILSGKPQRVLDEDSRIDIAMTRENANVTMQVTIGNLEVIPSGSPVNVIAAVGSLPRFDQDGVGSFFGSAGQEIAIFGSNTDAAASELRAQIRITSVDDIPFQPATVS